jgi:hypothetical protein
MVFDDHVESECRGELELEQVAINLRERNETRSERYRMTRDHSGT